MELGIKNSVSILAENREKWEGDRSTLAFLEIVTDDYGAHAK